MLEITSIIVMSIVLLSLTILMVTLFMKHLNVMYVFIEEMLKAQNSLYKELQAIRLELAGYVSSKANFKDIDINNGDVNMRIENEDTETRADYPRSVNALEQPNEVSDEELSKLIKDKDLIFRNQVKVGLDEEFIHTDIDYMQ